MPIKGGGITVHDKTYHQNSIIPAADQDFQGYRLKGLKRMSTVPTAAEIGTDGLVLYELPATATYYGGDGDSSDLAANYEIAYKITLSAGTITMVRLKCGAATNVKLALYDDDGAGGEPATQLVDWGAFAAVLGVNDFDVADYVVSAGDYWLGSLHDVTAPRYAAGARLDRYKARTYANGLESPWPNATDIHDTWNVYAQLGLGSPAVRRLYLNVNDTVIYFTPT